MPFIKDVYLDSQVTVGLLSNVTASIATAGDAPVAPRNVEEARPAEILTAAQTAAGRNFINEISGSSRMLCHGLLYVGKGNLAYIQEQTDQNQPDSWKGYNISNAAKVDNDPNSLMRQWRHDDEEVAYPTFELIEQNYRKLRDLKPGCKNICVHKGLAPGPPDPLRGHPGDMPKAARDWPNLNFITYHACIQPSFFLYDVLEGIKAGRLREGRARYRRGPPNTPSWCRTSRTSTPRSDHLGLVHRRLPNGGGASDGPAHEIHGTRPDRVRIGCRLVRVATVADRSAVAVSDPEDLREKYGYPEITEADKRKILGLNSAKLYGIKAIEDPQERARVYPPVPKDYESRMSDELKTLLEFPGYTADNLSKFKDTYVAMGMEPSHTRYGWIRTGA